jgi:Fuc2NAc and GlcNAc transferase
VNPVISIILIVLTGTFSALLTIALRNYALAHQVLDVPNERSSHHIPTPRGGGIAIVISFSTAILVMWATELISNHIVIGILGASTFVALVGFIDDHAPLAARWRLLAHFAAAAWILIHIGTPLLELPGGAVDLGTIGFVLCVLYLVWMLNLYNFMDGIDGLAGIESTTVTLSGAMLSVLHGMPSADFNSAVPMPSLALAAASLGFLIWNFPPAKIFMGDAGSGFLGITLGTLSLMAGLEAPMLFWSWVILSGVFVVDATVTLARRKLRRKILSEAHRSHAFQFAARRYGKHRPVTIAVALINVLWLLPIAWAVAAGWLNGVAGTLIAYAPLVLLALYFKAGAAELQSN